MDLRRLRHFAVLVETGSFVAAATRLNLTQSALSHSISSLEHQAGTALLDRRRGGVTLTKAGQVLAQEAVRVLHRMADLQHELKVVAGLEAATVRFGMAPLPATLWLADLLGDVVDEGDVVASATVGHATELTGLLAREAIDFFVCAREGLDRVDDLAITPLGPLPLRLMVRRGHPLDGQDAIEPADLAAFPLIGMGRAFLRGDPNEPAPLFRGGRMAVQSDDYAALIAVTMASDAILLAAVQVADAAADRIVALSVADIGRSMIQHLVLVQRPGRQLSPAASVVISRLAALATGAPLKRRPAPGHR